MKITIERDALVAGLASAKRLVSHGNVMDVLKCCLLTAEDNSLLIAATDLNVSTTNKIPVDCQSHGSVVVDTVRLFKVASALAPGPVDIEFMPDDFAIKVKSGKRVAKIKTLDAEDYPKIDTGDDQKYCEIPPGVLVEMITKVIGAIGEEIGRYVLAGAYIEFVEDGGLLMAATDGHIMCRVSREINHNGLTADGVIVPRDGIVEILEASRCSPDSASVAISEKSFYFKTDDFSIAARTISGKFPLRSINQIVDLGWQSKAVVDTAQMVDAVKFASIGNLLSITMEFKPESIIVSGNNPLTGKAENEVDAKHDGDEMKFNVNPSLMIGSLKNMGEKTTIETIDELSPLLFRSDDKDYLAAVMIQRR